MSSSASATITSAARSDATAVSTVATKKKSAIATHGFLNEKAVKLLEDKVVKNSEYGSLKRLVNSFVATQGDNSFLQDRQEVALKLFHIVVIAWKQGEKEKAARDAEKAEQEALKQEALKKEQPKVVVGNPEKRETNKDEKPAFNSSSSSSSSSAASASEGDKDKDCIEKSAVENMMWHFRRHNVFANATIVEEVTLEGRDGQVHCNEDLLCVMHGPLAAKMSDKKCIDVKKYDCRTLETCKHILYYPSFPSFEKMEKLERLQLLVELMQFFRDTQNFPLEYILEEFHYECKDFGTISDTDLEPFLQLFQQAMQVFPQLGKVLFEHIKKGFGLEIDCHNMGRRLYIHAASIQYLDPYAFDAFQNGIQVPSEASSLSSSPSSSAAASQVSDSVRAVQAPSKKAQLISQALRATGPHMYVKECDAEYLLQLAEFLDEEVGQSIQSVVFFGLYSKEQLHAMMEMAAQACPRLKEISVTSPLTASLYIAPEINNHHYSLYDACSLTSFLEKLKSFKQLETCRISLLSKTIPAVHLMEQCFVALDGPIRSLADSLVDESEIVPQLDFGTYFAFYIDKEKSDWFQAEFAGASGMSKLTKELAQKKMLQKYTFKEVTQPIAGLTYILFERIV
ncbi:MAG TPA: hypothetical protein VN457_03535 [Chlamydiales bacterium]|nr:hypothetical protein [Chlamydiales bacterium]